MVEIRDTRDSWVHIEVAEDGHFRVRVPDGAVPFADLDDMLAAVKTWALAEQASRRESSPNGIRTGLIRQR